MMHRKNLTNDIIDLNKRDLKFTREVKRRSGVNFNACLHCNTCAGGCQFSQIMDYMPNRIIRLVQLGLKKEALTCSSIWICVSCNTCSIQCPMGIDISSVTDAICQIAIDEKAEVGEPEILKFHEGVLKTIQRYGRTHKLEIMLRYKFYTHDWFRDMGVGLKMLAKNKLDILPSRINQIVDIKNIFSQKKAV
ncbi:MAG: 4Fe-4S dicluster domain-containing protein [Deltaproteobacteria bacterium]|nr:4Fe-4S dicluster domain-containing protein [Deltaproteobacteria bacterium]